MELRSDKSANKLYKEDRKQGMTTLSFKEWLQLKKSQDFRNLTGDGSVPVDTTLNDSVQQALADAGDGGQTQAGINYTFGVPNGVWLWGGIGFAVLIVAVIVYKNVKR